MGNVVKGVNMAEPISGSAAGILGWKLLGLGALVGSGVLGGVIMAVFDPPKDRKTLFMQGACAGVGSLFFGPFAVKALDYYVDFINLVTASPYEIFETAAPVYLILGALSWGVFGALAKLRSLLREHAAEALTKKIRMPPPPPTA